LISFWHDDENDGGWYDETTHASSFLIYRRKTNQ